MKTLPNVLALFLMLVAVSIGGEKIVIRVGHFPNITHVQGLVAHNLSRQGKGWCEARLGPGVDIQWFSYNAGPSAMEAIFAKSIELTYVGPGPALNAYAKSQGEEIRIIAGAANGGAALVVQPEANFKAPIDFKGKDRNAAAREYARYFLPCLAGVRWTENHPTRRRRSGAANAKSRSAFPFSTKENRRRLDGGALGIAT